MAPLTQITAVALSMLRDNIDTDAIIPSREIRSVGKTGLAQGLFAGWRYLPGAERTPDPEFVLNSPAYRGAQILLAGENFGCGSSREHAVWALAEYGFRAVLAPSFNSIFYRNCLRNSVLPARVAPADLSAIAAWVEQDPQHNRPTVDLVARTIVCAVGSWSFDIADEARAGLLAGRDEIDQTLQLGDAIAAFRAADRLRRPWVYDALPSRKPPKA
jgi:3-isopropylmalate/(R)-2-methylmalate dehydratase small subunit